jgi:antitoxin (DNA-binding transcriptional repressor) of toxin-antitoxin stability system
MKSITATALARNLKRMLDQVEFKRESLSIVRNNQQIARIIPGAAQQNALEAMADLFRVLSDEDARDWVRDSRIRGGVKQLRDPWDS